MIMHHLPILFTFFLLSWAGIYDNVPDTFPTPRTTHSQNSCQNPHSGDMLNTTQDPSKFGKRSLMSGTITYTSTGSGPCWSGSCGGGFGVPQKCHSGYEQTGFVQICANCGGYICGGPSAGEQEFAAVNPWGCSSSYPWMGISVRECTPCPLWDGTPLTQLVGRKILIQSTAQYTNGNYLSCNNARPWFGYPVINAPSSSPSFNAEFVISSAVSSTRITGYEIQLTMACGGGNVGLDSYGASWACNTTLYPTSIIGVIPLSNNRVNFVGLVSPTYGAQPMSVMEGGSDGLVVSNEGSTPHNLYVCPCGLSVQAFTATGPGPCWSGSTCGTKNYGTPASCPVGTTQTAYNGLCANCGNYYCTGSSWAEGDFRTLNNWGCPVSYPWLPISVRECSSCVATCTA